MDIHDYNPDILNCLANLSSDEVFTPPELANQMLDLLPQDLFSNPDTRFLDPCSKSGVFLREITKRLIRGLETTIPDLQERVNHILQKQVFGIALTQLTAEMSRRTLYCTKRADSRYSVATMPKADGMVYFQRLPHLWTNGRCTCCGANEEVYQRGEKRENYAYPFIHQPFNEIYNMQFDVIIGNPPYQLNDGGGTGSSAMPIYQYFVQNAIKLNPRYLCMIIPSRWFAGGKGLDEFREQMLSDKHLRKIVDYFDSTECFPGVDLSGGVCYFLWDKNYKGDCEVTSIRKGKASVMYRPLLEKGSDAFVRFNEAISILRKVNSLSHSTFDSIVSARKPFGDIRPQLHSTKGVYVFAYPESGYISKEDVKQNSQWIDQYKVYIAKAYGERGDFPYLVVGKPFIGEKGTCCTETYLVIGPFNEKAEAENAMSYMRTKFFRFFVLFKKNTQNAARGVYSFVPLQDFSKPWTDEELYDKYNLSETERAFIESMIRPME